MYGFDSLTSITLRYISCYLLLHPGSPKLCFKSWYILLLPGCIENLQRCSSSRIYFLNSIFLGTTILFLKYRIFCSSRVKQEASPLLTRSRRVFIPLSSCWALMICSFNVSCKTRFLRVPCSTIYKFSSSKCWHKVLRFSWAVVQWHWAFLLKASATTLALPGW